MDLYVCDVVRGRRVDGHIAPNKPANIYICIDLITCLSLVDGELVEGGLLLPQLPLLGLFVVLGVDR